MKIKIFDSREKEGLENKINEYLEYLDDDQVISVDITPEKQGHYEWYGVITFTEK